MNLISSQQRLRSEVMRVLPAAALQLQDLAAFQTRGVSVRFLLRDVPALLTAHAILLIPDKPREHHNQTRRFTMHLQKHS